jgi:hypothetical protein
MDAVTVTTSSNHTTSITSCPLVAYDVPIVDKVFSDFVGAAVIIGTAPGVVEDGLEGAYAAGEEA